MDSCNTGKEIGKREELESLLKAHDWTYMMSDDYGVWARGNRSEKEIRGIVEELGDVGVHLFNKHCPDYIRGCYHVG